MALPPGQVVTVTLTRQEFAEQMCLKMGWPAMDGPVVALVTLFSFEDSTAALNPEATEQPEPGSTDYNSAGVQNFPNMTDAALAFAATFDQTIYADLDRAFKSGAPANVILSNPQWDTYAGFTGYTAKLLAMLDTVNADRPRYFDVPVAGSQDVAPVTPTPAPAPDPTPAPAPAPAEETCSPVLPVLRQGDTGPAVRSLQGVLNAHGAHLAVDADFGPITTEAVRRFQQDQGMEVSGVVGVATFRHCFPTKGD